jgi:hypothetical protein
MSENWLFVEPSSRWSLLLIGPETYMRLGLVLGNWTGSGIGAALGGVCTSARMPAAVRIAESTHKWLPMLRVHTAMRASARERSILPVPSRRSATERERMRLALLSLRWIGADAGDKARGSIDARGEWLYTLLAGVRRPLGVPGCGV